MEVRSSGGIMDDEMADVAVSCNDESGLKILNVWINFFPIAVATDLADTCPSVHLIVS